ncbi:MAG TPA: SRPBCC family protein [Solirubrobacteraceae bacterium]|jgi:hypothetical protein
MGSTQAAIAVAGTIAGAEELWYDLTRWPAFVDGFGHVTKQDEDWPRAGTLVWDSNPGGRERVIERVTYFEARIGQDAEVEDGKLTGTQRLRFAALGDGRVEVALELRYALKDRTPLTPLLDVFFIRRALGDSLRRTLVRFSRELAADRELAGGP